MPRYFFSKKNAKNASDSEKFSYGGFFVVLVVVVVRVMVLGY
jgi:hypothetical protein